MSAVFILSASVPISKQRASMALHLLKTTAFSGSVLAAMLVFQALPAKAQVVTYTASQFDNTARDLDADTYQFEVQNADFAIQNGLITESGGARPLEKIGTGILAFGSDNTYTGPTTITAGSLQLGIGGASGNVGSGPIINNGALRVNRSDDFTLANIISGTGTFAQNGTNITMLSGDNSYAGLTTINGVNFSGNIVGALHITHSNALGTTAGGTVVNLNGTLQLSNDIFVGDEALSINGSGLGGLGALSNLSGDNSFIGRITLMGEMNNRIGIQGGSLTLLGGIGGSNTPLTVGGAGNLTVNGGIDTGAAGLTKDGTGTLTLENVSLYEGVTTVSAGTLIANGSNASSGFTIASNATLGGSGTLAGAVTVQSGGIFAPGNSPGTVTVGSLTLASGSTLEMELTQPNFIGGANNDLINVTDDLALNGATLNITSPTGFGSGFGQGSYRLINYGGTLTQSGGGLLLGTYPDPSTLTPTIQTSINGQINLIVDGPGIPTQFWDGTNVVSNNTVDGGTFNWNNSTGNWTVTSGSFNNNWSNGLGIFTGTAGTVSVTENVNFSDLQFITDGYNVIAAGGTIRPDTDSGIRVDAGSTATIGAQLVGPTASIEKLGDGTLVLSGVNTYEGTTTVTAGTLQIASTGRLSGGGAVTVDASATLNNAGIITGYITNNGTTIISGTINTGLLVSGITNNGTLTNTGTIVGTLENSGIANVQGEVNGVVNNLAGTFNLTGTTISISDFTQSAGATFNLNGFNTSLGTLQGEGTVNLGSAVLTLGYTNQYGQFDGSITGSGRLIIDTTSSIALTGTSNFTGGVNIINGSYLLVQNQGLGTGPVDVGPSAALHLDRPSTDGTFSGAISGSGIIYKSGAGALTLTGVNTFTGLKYIYGGGTLRGAAASLGFGNFIINEAGTRLVLDQPTDVTFSNQISGNAFFDKTGVGRVDLTGNSTGFTGTTNVLAGNLAVNGNLGASTVNVANGATLSGNGTVGNTTFASGATASPGNSVGTLNINGNVIFSPNSIYFVEVNPTAADRITATGTATLAGTLSLNPVAGVYTFGTEYTLVSAAGGRTGTFDATLVNGGFGPGINVSVGYDATRAFLRLNPNAIQPLVGATPVTRNIASTIDGFDRSILANTLNSTPFFSLFALPAGQIPAAMNQMSGEAHASLAGRTAEDHRLIREAVLKQSAQFMAPGFHAWGQGFGNWGRVSSDGNAASNRTETGGFVLGIEGATEGGYKVGAFGGLTHSNLDAVNVGSSGTAQTIHGGVNAAATFGAFSMRTGVSFGDTDAKLTRNIAFTGFADTLNSTARHRAVQSFTEASWRYGDAKRSLEPFMQLTGLKLWTGSFAETGGAARLTGQANDMSLGFTTLGVRGTYVVPAGDVGALTLKGMLGARYSFGDTTPTNSLMFAGTGQTFKTWGVPISRMAAVVETSADWNIMKQTSIGISYSGVLSKDAQEHALKGQLEVKF